jgi:hypothetical protein
MNARYLSCGLAAILLLPVSTSGDQDAQHASHVNTGGPLPEAVRRATAAFRDLDAALAAGYAQAGGCVSGPDEGAMGVHFSKQSLFDGVVRVEEPEVLVYEPRHGRLQLVAAEYVIPADAWDPSHDPFDKPHVMGHLFHFLAGPNRYGPNAIYELHVWAWKNNPRGAFADWNPNVSCSGWGG